MRVRQTGLVYVLALGAAFACANTDSGGPVNSPVSFSMNAFNGSGVSGTARIEDQAGDASTVTVVLQGVPPGGHAGHVHRGSCADQGAILFGLNPITPDAQGNGSATSGGVPDALLVPGFYIQYHVALDPPGDPIACADIPMSSDSSGDGYGY
jgi:hypothetical protein